MTDSRPEPRWGQYADVPPPPPEPVLPPPVAPAPRPRRTGDIVLTTGLLLIGVIDVVRGWGYYSSLAATLRELYELQSFPPFTSDALANSVGFATNIIRLVILLVAIAVSLSLIARGRRAFWVPLAAGALAALVLVLLLLVVMLQDPALVEYVQQQSGSTGN